MLMRPGEANAPRAVFLFWIAAARRVIGVVSRGEISPEALAFSKLTPESTLSLDAGPRCISTCRGLRLGPTDRLLQRPPAGKSGAERWVKATAFVF